jgi:hypothetical protein
MATRLIYYVLKVKGLAKIPDYLQVRDERFSLIFYGRPDRPEKRTPLPPGLWERLLQAASDMPYGKVQKVEWDPHTQSLIWHEPTPTP